MDNVDQGNGKVTLALLGLKMDMILIRLDKLDICNSAQDNRLNALEQGQVERRTQITEITRNVKELSDIIEGMKSRDWWTSGISGVLAFVASAIMSFFRGTP